MLAPLAAGVLAQDNQPGIDVLTEMAGALSEGNITAFLKPIDRSLPKYAELRDAVNALIEQNYVISTIEVLRNEGDDNRRSVDLDWFLQVEGKQPAASLRRRRQIVRCRLEKKKKKWFVVGLEPVEFFAPLKPGR